MQNDDEIDLRSIFKFFLAHIWLIGIFGFIAAVAAIVYVKTLEPRFTSRVSMYLQEDGGGALDPLAGLSGARIDDKRLRSEVFVISSNRLLGEVVDILDLTNDPEFNADLREPEGVDALKFKMRRTITGTIEAIMDLVLREQEETSFTEDGEPLFVEDKVRYGAIATLQRDLSVDIAQGTLIVTVAYEASSPEKAALIATTIAETYISDRLEVKYEANNQSLVYLRNRLPVLKQDVEDAERAIADFRSTAGVMSAETLGATNALLAETLEQIDRLDERYRAATELVSRYGEQDMDAETARNILNMTDYSGNLPSGAALINAARRELARQREVIAGYSDRAERLNSTAASLRDRIRVQGEKAIGLSQLEREAEANRVIYENFLGKLKEVSQASAVRESDVRVVSNASTVGGPTYPRPLAILVIFTFVGLALGTLLSFMRDFYFAPFRTTDEVAAATGLPVLIATPDTGRASVIGKGSESRRGKMLINAIRDLRSLITINAPDGNAQVVMLTSTIPSEGKTTTAALLAQANALAKRRTLLVDCDFWRQRLSKQLGGGEHGFMQVLEEDLDIGAAIIDCKSIEGVHLLPAGKPLDTASNLLVDPMFEDAINQLRSAYDAIIIDCPPMIAGSDARVISRVADVVTYLVHAKKSRRVLVKRHVAQLAAVAKDKVKLVLTHAKGDGSGYGYGYGYGYGSYRYKEGK